MGQPETVLQVLYRSFYLIFHLVNFTIITIIALFVSQMLKKNYTFISMWEEFKITNAISSFHFSILLQPNNQYPIFHFHWTYPKLWMFSGVQSLLCPLHPSCLPLNCLPLSNAFVRCKMSQITSYMSQWIKICLKWLSESSLQDGQESLRWVSEPRHWIDGSHWTNSTTTLQDY